MDTGYVNWYQSEAYALWKSNMRDWTWLSEHTRKAADKSQGNGLFIVAR